MPAGSPGWSDFGQILPHGLDDAATPHPQSYGDPHPPEDQHPQRGGCFLGHALLLGYHPHGNQWPDGIAERENKAME